MDHPVPAVRTPDPVDPAAAPRILLRAALVVLLVGVLMVLLGAKAATAPSGRPLVSAATFVSLWLISVPVGGLLLFAHWAVGRWRLRKHERHFGFLPRVGRKDLPRTSRTTLVRLEYGSRDDRVCLMLARWDYGYAGWQRRRVLDHVWEQADDAVAIGEQRARLGALGEKLEEDFDDARLAGDGERELIDESSSEAHTASEESRRFAEALARDQAG
jgi:hypothetical protein